MGEPVRFYLDEHIPSAVAEGLRQRGIKVRTLVEMDRLGAQDKEPLAHARRDSRVLVTHDDDVLRLAAEGTSHAGIVDVLRERSIGDIVRGLVGIARVSSEEDLRQQIRFL
ncbi:DUF5615 family PIN-like protein [Salinibacter ruber]|uniref:Nuclease of putative toxin-antitoxin system n=1 Tax=Salinibacter ruber TaxID=146919 RepID=A0A9X2U6M8_9BACT|nr:DUF5615 family PIN-like protein [Salinibacter ruber]MCS3950908.1 putative nuclease of putative toxin-antitoxin system [Salinibacter ruber]